ncbi:MAG: STAS domain-containing protein [Rhodospirillaceae bacterium]|jgi:anti-anti-sigma factor|nr:STAS domain-containing protein [Rhodospirillaceae bacterium]MBT4043291.1 STAS domain-containing protein [Rhodospirillaceae bacterium]MBT4690815.1 STAS domain-containing protein [Rhodospirillaceae bacterium]
MSGKLDTGSSDQAHEKMTEIATSGQVRVVLNLSRVDYVGSAGLRVILGTSKLLQSQGRTCHLRRQRDRRRNSINVGLRPHLVGFRR